MASLLMEPQSNSDGMMIEFPVVKVVRKSLSRINNKYHFYRLMDKKQKLLEYVSPMKPQIKKWIGRNRKLIITTSLRSNKPQYVAFTSPGEDNHGPWTEVVNNLHDIKALMTGKIYAIASKGRG